MNSDWKEYTFEGLKAPSKGAFAMGPFGSNIKAENFVSSGVPVIKGGNLNGTYLVEDFKDFLSEEKAATLSASKVRALDLVITHRGTLGQVGLIPENSKYLEYIVSQSQLKLSFDRSFVDPYFIYYFLRSSLGQQRLLANTSQVGVPAIAQALKTVRQIKIRLPALETQLKICELLRRLDDRIVLLRETNVTLESIAQALFKSWFVDFDPVRAKMDGRVPEGMDEGTAALFPDAVEESALGAVPTGWYASTLAEQTLKHGGTIQTGPFGSQLHASDYSESGTPVAMPKDIADRRINTSSVARVAAEHVTRLARHQLSDGDILFSRRGDVERHALVTAREVGWLCGTGCLLVRPGKSWQWPAYLSMLLDTPKVKHWLVRHAVGATMPNLNTGILGSIPVVVPHADVLNQFEQIAMALETRRSESLATMTTLALLRDTLLPRLISGQLRLPDVENQIEAISA